MAATSVVVEDLVVRYGTTEAVRGVSFTIDTGQVFGLLGPNGAGKTSILRVLVGLITPAAGRASILGHDVAHEQRTVRRLIGYVPQALSADGSLTGHENASLFAKLYGVPRRIRGERIDDVLGLMGLGSAAHDVVQGYSGGMVRRLEIACALLSSPHVLLLDEPTLGLDPVARRGVWEHIHRQRLATDTSVLVTTHDMDEAEAHCQQVTVISSGQVVAQGAPSDLRSELRADATLEDVFIALTGPTPIEDRGGLRDVRRARRTARRLG